MTYKENIQKIIETSAKAPIELRQQTFKKIDQLNVVFELLGFYSSIPQIFLDMDRKISVNQK